MTDVISMGAEAGAGTITACIGAVMIGAFTVTSTYMYRDCSTGFFVPLDGIRYILFPRHLDFEYWEKDLAEEEQGDVIVFEIYLPHCSALVFLSYPLLTVSSRVHTTHFSHGKISPFPNFTPSVKIRFPTLFIAVWFQGRNVTLSGYISKLPASVAHR